MGKPGSLPVLSNDCLSVYHDRKVHQTVSKLWGMFVSVFQSLSLSVSNDELVNLSVSLAVSQASGEAVVAQASGG